MATPKFIMLVGVPGSGKTTWRSKNIPKLFPVNTNNVNCFVCELSTDDVIEDIARQYDLTYNDAFSCFEFANKVLDNRLKKALANNWHIVLDQTNISINSRAKKLSMIPDHYEKIAYVFPIPPQHELTKRLDGRPGKKIPHHVMSSMISRFQIPHEEEGFDKVVMVE